VTHRGPRFKSQQRTLNTWQRTLKHNPRKQRPLKAFHDSAPHLEVLVEDELVLHVLRHSDAVHALWERERLFVDPGRYVGRPGGVYSVRLGDVPHALVARLVHPVEELPQPGC
jgi:hypothetical protein